uniref:PAX-interacting protein 1 n=1 Tax=Astatotilapia calliptera TaxID=8154 RepID=A0AAX7UX15_ASTCA
MSEEEIKVSDELFKDVKFYVVGDIDQKVVQLLKAGKAKEVSYNALATHIIAEDGDNPEVGESREVFDLPVVKPSWVILSVRCGDLLPVTGFSPESGQIFFGVTACLPRVSLPDDLNALWAYITFYGGECQLNLNKKVTHLVLKEPKGAKFECALKHSGIKIVTPDWITDSVKDKARKEEALYHPRLTYVEPEEEEESEAESYNRHSDGSYSPQRSRLSSGGSSDEESSPRRRPGPKRLNSVSPTSPRKPERRSERMFDDSDDDSSTEKEGTNLNWTPAEVVTPAPPITTGTARRRSGPPGIKDPVSSTGSGLINLCANVPPVPGISLVTPNHNNNATSLASSGVSVPESMSGWSPAVRTLRNITNNSDMQPANRAASVHIIQPANQTKPLEQQTNQSHAQTLNSTNVLLFNQAKLTSQPLTAEQQQLLQQQQSNQAAQQHQQLSQQPQHPMMHLQQQQQMMQLQHHPQQQPQQQQFLQQQQQQQMHQQQMFSQQQQQHVFSQQQLRPQQPLRPGLQQLQQQQLLQQQLQQLQQQQRMQMLQQNQQQMHQQHLQQQQQQHFMQQHHQMQQKQHLQNQHQNQQAVQQQQTAMLQPPLQQPPHVSQLFGHDDSNFFLSAVPQDGFLLGCVFGIADYPEQMADKQLLATWKRVIQACGGSVDPTLTSRCTHLLCESQVSSMYVQALREGKRCVTAHWLNTVLKKKRMVPPHRTLHVPFAFPPGAKPCSQHIISVTGFMDADRDDLKLMAYLAGARYTGYLCRSNTVLICKEPSGLKYEKAKEWKIPCVNAQWLCDILLGNFEALRQIQHSRYSIYTHPEPLVPNPQLVQNLLAAWRTPIKVSSEALAVSFCVTVFFTFFCLECREAPLEEIQSPSKKLPPESTPRVMFTGFEPMQVQQYTKRLHALGGELADSSQKVTHLVASKVTRTVKFLTAMSVVKHIVTPEWLEESWRSQKFVDEQSCTLRDAEAEVLFGFSLEESLKRAQSAPLFKGKYFYLTPGICPSLSTMKSILESAGGKLLTKQPSYRKIMEHNQNKNLPEIILISCDNDLHLCREYFLKNIDVHNAEFILTGVLTQKLDYESYPLHHTYKFT